jgi:hypothetical protein
MALISKSSAGLSFDRSVIRAYADTFPEVFACNRQRTLSLVTGSAQKDEMVARLKTRPATAAASCVSYKASPPPYSRT